MNQDQVKGRAEEVAGKTKKVVGGACDDTLKNKVAWRGRRQAHCATYGVKAICRGLDQVLGDE
jgi:hypothetical protein